MKIRYRIITIYKNGGWMAEVQTRREHMDPEHSWGTEFSTENYYLEADAERRGQIYVNEHLPHAIK